MSEVSSLNNKRIAKNTLMLYIRMFLMMGVNLYTSRIILQALGVDDFGIYNIVGGIVVLFTFINNAMVASTQRFLNFELGRNNVVEAGKVFSASVTIHCFISLLFLVLSETIGLWFLNEYIQVPEGRELAANWVYQFTIIATIFYIMRTPYNGAIIAEERMSFYAYISVIEGFLKLAIAFLVYCFVDRLIWYAIFMAIVSFWIYLGYYIYCKRKFPLVCTFRYEYDKQRYRSLVGFSGWSLFGAVSNMGAQQGLNVLLNIFFGVTLNAAMGIANQVNNAVYTFVSNFQTAFNPQIVKTYANQNRSEFIGLLFNSSRYSFFLLFMLALPICIYCDELLYLWLGTVPKYSSMFCRIMIINSMFDALSGPLWMAVYASGRIKKYQICISILLLSTLLLAYIFAHLGLNPYMVLLVKPLVGLFILIYRIVYCKNLIDLSMHAYFKNVVEKCILVLICSLLFSGLIFICYSHTTLAILFVKIFMTFFICIVAVYFFGITKNEKEYIHTWLHRIKSTVN